VTAQADQANRGTTSDIANLKTRSNSGEMVPIGSVANFKDETGPYRVERYNLFPAVEVDGDRARLVHGILAVDDGEARRRPPSRIRRRMDCDRLPAGECRQHGWPGVHVGWSLVFLVLAAQHESLILPLAIILIVPMCLFAAMIGVNLRGMDNNVLTQIGLVVLIALAKTQSSWSSSPSRLRSRMASPRRLRRSAQQHLCVQS
jgi:multidrug efflux pump subunit AcrB